MYSYFEAFMKELLGEGTAQIAANDNWAAIQAKLVRELRMGTLKPKNLASELRLRILRDNYQSSEELARKVEEIKPDELKDFKIGNLGGFHIEALAGGNILSTEIHKHLEVISTNLGVEHNIMPRSDIKHKRVYQLPLGRYRLKVNNQNGEDVNSVVVNYYQHEAVTFRDTIILELISVS
eukprot:sb/3471705/